MKVTIDKQKDTPNNLLNRFDKNSQALYNICIAVLKDLSNKRELIIVNVLDSKYQKIIENTTEDERLIDFASRVESYISKIMNKDEDFFNNLGSMMLDKYSDNVIQIVGNDLGKGVIDTLKNMISRITQVDQGVKDRIWKILINMLKISHKFKLVTSENN